MDKGVALKKIEKFILSCGFEDTYLRKNYKFVVNNKVRHVASADLVFFSDQNRPDIGTSCISVDWMENEHSFDNELIKHKFLATPIVIFPTPQAVRFYDLRNVEPVVNNISYDLLEKYFSTNRLNFSRESLETAKRAEIFQQMTLFATDATKQLLVTYFESAVRIELNRLDPSLNTDIVNVSIHVLAACIIEDKLWASESQSDNILQLLNKCIEVYPKYFKNILGNKIREEIADRIYKHIRNELTFQALTNDILGYFYEFAILKPEVKKSFGIYWTDEHLARKICNNLPFELLSLDNISIVDGTCGSGSLLLSACERVEKLFPNRMSGQEKHDWLTENTVGVEIEQLSSEIAKLSLLLYSLPYGNNWKIINSDFMKVDLSKRPSVIVGNPPFRESRVDQLASQFVTKYLDILIPGGIMGIILPVSYLESDKCIVSRKHLLDISRIMEIWFLPEGAFRTSKVATIVLLLRKNKDNISNKSYPVKVIDIRKAELSNFIKNNSSIKGTFVNSSQWYSDSKSRIYSSTMDNILDKILIGKKIENIAEIRQGIIPKENADDFGDVIKFEEEHKWVKWLQSPSNNALEPYIINWKNFKHYNRRYTSYPGSHLWPRPGLLFEEPKIIINAKRNSESIWRVYGAIDQEAYYVSQSFFVIHMKDSSVSMEELVSIINHPISSLFINKFNRRTTMKKENIASIPFPSFDVLQKQKIINIVKEITRRKTDGNGSSSKVRELIASLDDIVYDAYHVSLTDRKKINEYMSRSIRPGVEWKDERKEERKTEVDNSRVKTWKLAGQIEEINVDEGTVNISLQGKEDSFTVPLPASLPGWGLEPGVSFEVDIPFVQRYENDISKYEFNNFRMLSYGYLSEEELEEKTFGRRGFESDRM